MTLEVLVPAPIQVTVTSGAPGPRGAPGIGIPAGGDPGQVVTKGLGSATLWDTPTKTIDKVALPSVIGGSITSQTANSITDSTKSWEPDALIDAVVKLDSGVVSEYAIVLSNTADTLIFDDVLLNPAISYNVIDSIAISSEDMPCLVALDITNGCCAVILPESTPLNERSYIHSYIERAQDGLYKAPIMCRGTERQAGQKYGTLEHRFEGVRLYAHQWITPHWDIIQTYNIVRVGSTYWDAPQSGVAASWAPVLGMQSLLMKRFAVEDSWLRYLSLLPRTFIATFSAHINKTGGVGELDIALAKRDADGVITFLDTIYTSTRFGAGIGIATLVVSTPVNLNYRESLIGVARTTGGTFSITEGSSLIVQEI